MADDFSETQVARLCIERKLLVSEELDACLLEQKRLLKEEDKRASLSEVMLKLGYVTRSQLGRLNGDLQDTIARKAQQIPGFQLICRLGKGAMATVFKARQLSLDRLVAVKILNKELSKNKEFVEQLYREGKAAASLNHNNIVQAIDVGEAGGYHYFIMEYIDGNTVHDRLAAGKLYSENDALDIILQIARALDHVARHGFTHRDVKPRNIMLTRDGVAKLADLGLARATSDVKLATAQMGRAYGTPYYISPEQIRGELIIDCRADIYSLGATFYHMVRGKVPFEGGTPEEVMLKHLHERLVPPDHLVATLSNGAGKIIEHMMEKKRENRYQTVKDLMSDLEALQRGEPLQVGGPDIGRLGDVEKGGKLDEKPPVKTDVNRSGTQLAWIFVFAALLGVSVIVNVILIARH